MLSGLSNELWSLMFQWPTNCTAVKCYSKAHICVCKQDLQYFEKNVAKE